MVEELILLKVVDQQVIKSEVIFFIINFINFVHLWASMSLSGVFGGVMLVDPSSSVAEEDLRMLLSVPSPES